MNVDIKWKESDGMVAVEGWIAGVMKPTPCLPILGQNRVDFRYYFYAMHCKITYSNDIWL